MVYLTESSGDVNRRESGYTLIPRASQSVKVLAEIPMFTVILFQLLRNHIYAEVIFE